MSFKRGFQPEQRFRETLTYEEIIRGQMQKCLEAFNFGDPTQIMYAVESLALSITGKMADDEFLAQLEDLDEGWKEQSERLERNYLKEMKAAGDGCPDLVAKPSMKPDAEYWKRMFAVCLDLFQRKGLLLKEKTTAEL